MLCHEPNIILDRNVKVLRNIFLVEALKLKLHTAALDLPLIQGSPNLPHLNESKSNLSLYWLHYAEPRSGVDPC